jgi:hypothetical protein
MPIGTQTSIPGEVVDIDGDFAVVSNGPTPRNVSFTDFIFARNQGGKDNWGEVTRMHVPTFGIPPAGAGAIAGDTAFLGYRGVRPIDVYVADTDRDGLSDRLDPCPRDPLNNIAGGCARNSSAYLVLDDQISLGDVTTETRGNELDVTATFTNTSDAAIGNPFFEVIELGGGNLLVNADAGPGTIGATLSPDVGDGILSPGESVTVTFVIGLETHEAFRYYVSVRGESRR